ncbi:hypothetical protein [Thalassovita sp.]|uniref:hypothetical protein n=1 Tax=Thalassovita sp. TaxID=1979401 RepID=UPI00288284DB|nr:hypothetical protein [Thalassovita sp.]MDF1802598.1 hypothetical protein [Thalassovita sp.]
MFHQKIDLESAEKLLPELLQHAGMAQPQTTKEEPGVLRLLRELTQSNLFATKK